MSFSEEIELHLIRHMLKTEFTTPTLFVSCF